MSLFRWAFGRYARRRISRGLDGLWVAGLERAQQLLQDRPVVFAATHVAWWDGLLLLPLDDALGQAGRVWMDAANLQRMPYFARLGALPLDRSSPPALKRSVEGALSWLQRPGRSLWIFPQGQQRPPWLRPLVLAPGAGKLAKRAGAHLVPVGLQYGFRQAPAPSAVLSFGAPVSLETPGSLEDGLLQQLDFTDRFFLDGQSDFFPLVPGRVQGTEHKIWARALSWWVGRG